MADSTSTVFGAPLYAADGSDAVDFANQVNAVTSVFDAAAVMWSSGNLADIPTPTVGPGQRYYASDYGVEFLWDGSAWQQSSEPPLVSGGSLPASPVDGMVVRYLVSAATGIIWTLRYRSASASTHKWEFVGGADFDMQNATAETRGPALASGTFFGFNSPPTFNGGTTQFTAPLDGDYLCRFGATAQLDNAQPVSVELVVIRRDTVAVIGNNASFDTLANDNEYGNPAGEARVGSTTAGTTFGLGFAHSNTASIVLWRDKFLSVRPVAVG